MSLLIFPIIILAMYMLLLRPQQQRLRRQRELTAAVDVGDEVVTAGGIIGRVVDLENDRAHLEVDENVVIEVLRAAISQRLPASGGQARDQVVVEDQEPADPADDPGHGDESGEKSGPEVPHPSDAEHPDKDTL